VGADAGLGPGLRTLLAAACGVSVANVYDAQPLLDRIGADLNVPADGLGLVTAVTQLGYLLGLILIVPLGDLVSRPRLIVTQALVAAAGLLVAALARDAVVFFAASAVVGLACAVVQVIVAYAAALSAPERRGSVVGTVTSGVVIGILLSRTVSGFAADLLGWRAVYLMSAALMLVLAVTLGCLLPRDTGPRARVPYPALISSVLTLTVHDRVFRVRSVLGLLMFGCFGAVWGSIALPLSAAPWHLSAGQIGLFGIAGAAGALSASRAGRLADRGYAQAVTGVSLVLLALSWAGTRAAPHSLLLLAAGVVLLDFAGQALHVTSQHLIVGTGSAASSRIIGSYMVYYSVGTGGGAIAATSLYALAGWGAVCALGAGLSTLALLVWAAASRHRQPALPAVSSTASTSMGATVTTYYRKARIDGTEIFYREAGHPGNPAFLLLHGFPASSFMFRQLIDRLAGQFHVIAPDYPGFGHSDAPPRARFSYTFDHLTDVIERFTEQLGLSRYGLYLQDFGGPVGFRLAARHPERVTFLVIQNANAYEEGLPDSFWTPLRALWADPGPANREAIRAAGMSDAALEWNYVHGTADPAGIDPDSWLLQKTLLNRPGNKDAMLDLLYDYRTNLGLYPRWHEYFRAQQPPTLIIWGGNDEIFPEAGAHPYRSDLPRAEIVILDAGHFALEDHADVIAQHISRFTAPLALSGGSDATAAPAASS